MRTNLLEQFFLREDHPVRRVMAQAIILWYLQWEKDRRDPDDMMTQECPIFAADLPYELRETLDT